GLAGGGWGGWGERLMAVVWTSRSAMPSAAMAFSTLSIVVLFSASACAAVAAWVTTPVVTSAMSGRADTAAVPVTVMEGAVSSAPRDDTGVSRSITAMAR